MYSKKFKKAFTMIELIFVIVIIGILASVALPKLAATRDDATVSQIEANIKQLIVDVQSYYTAQGKDIYLHHTRLPDVTDIPLDAHPGCGGPLHTGGLVGKTLHYCVEGIGVFVVTSPNDGKYITLTAENNNTHIGKLLQTDKVFQKFTNGTSGKKYNLTVPQVNRF